MRCPYCRSDNVSSQFGTVGSITKKSGNGFKGNMNNLARGVVSIGTLGISNLFQKESRGEEKTTVQYGTICVCQNCHRYWKVKY